MMTSYELGYWLALPFLPTLYSTVRSQLKQLINQNGGGSIEVLDVGGRQSPYTIGLPSQVTLLDVPRQATVLLHSRYGQ